MLDNHDLVFKLFLNKPSEGPDVWIPKAKEEQTRFEMYRNFAENEMAFCFGQVFLDVNNAEGDGSIRTGIRWQGDESKTNGAASATVVEKLIVVGKNQLITCLGLECTAEHWQSFAQMQIEILRLMFRFLHHGIAPWDAKLDNVGLAQPRPPSSSPAWVFCDLDGLRDKREWKNLGSAFKRIIKTMTTSDRDMLRPHEMQARRNGWVGPVEEMQALIYSAFVTHEFGTEHWSWLCLHYGLKKIVRIRKGCKHLSTGRGPCVSVCVCFACISKVSFSNTGLFDGAREEHSQREATHDRGTHELSVPDRQKLVAEAAGLSIAKRRAEGIRTCHTLEVAARSV